jgi:hypothetical protein
MKASVNLAVGIVALLTLVIAGCEKASEPEPCRRYSITVNNSYSSPIEGASVSIQTSSGTYRENTSSKGKATLTIPNDVSLPEYVVLTIDHSSIMPEGRSYSGDENTSVSKSITCSRAPSRILVKDVTLHHTGDDNYGGSENSQLQIPTEGKSISYSFNLSSIPSSMPHIRFFARGVQYKTEVIINGITTDRFIDSPSDGSLGRYSFQLTADPYTVFRVGNNTLTIKSGVRESDGDWDDLEFCSLLFYYP